jgi:putative ABC transport system permease protein
MLYNQILVMLRSLLKNKVYVSINIIGLSFAMACCVVAFWLVKHDILFDAHHTNGDQIYRVGQLRVDDTFPKKFGRVPVPIAEAFRNNYSNFPSTRFYHSYSNVKVGEDLFSPNIYYVDQDFFTMFSFPTVEGTIQFPHKNSVLLTENMAIKLFGSPKEAMGKTLLQIYGTEEKEFVVTGVLKEQPSSSSFYNEHGTTFVLFDNCKDEHKSITVDNWNSEFSFYFQIPDPNVLEGIHKFFGSLIENNNRVRKDFPLASFPLDQFSVMARADRSDNTLNQTHEPPSSAMLMAVIIMGTLMFLIGTFNLVNTVVAISSKRLKEIGVRKVMGGNRFSLVLQFLSESIFIAFLSFLLAVVISIYLTEGWNSLWEEFKLYPVYDVYFWSFILIMSLIVGGLAGIYPALYISSFDPTVILKGNQKFGGASFLSKILLGGQFAISIIGVVCSVAIYQNSIYQRDYDYGFNPKSSIIVWLNSSEEVALFKREIEKNPDIISVAGSNSGIFSNYHHSVVSYNQQTLETDIIQVGTNYLSTLDLKLIEGRDFNDESENDQRESIIVTENYVKSYRKASNLSRFNKTSCNWSG